MGVEKIFFAENTMVSFVGALKAGADGFETDLVCLQHQEVFSTFLEEAH